MLARVLVFDDEELVRELLQALCERQGYEVITFPHPGICPLHGKNECPCGPESFCADVIISDLQMPVVQGLDFLESLLGKGCHCRHIALVTGSVEVQEVARAAKLGCKLFAKPFNQREISDWLDQVKRSLPANRCLYDWHRTNLMAKPPVGAAVPP